MVSLFLSGEVRQRSSPMTQGRLVSAEIQYRKLDFVGTRDVPGRGGPRFRRGGDSNGRRGSPDGLRRNPQVAPRTATRLPAPTPGLNQVGGGEAAPTTNRDGVDPGARAPRVPGTLRE